jgi:hypothetical protein
VGDKIEKSGLFRRLCTGESHFNITNCQLSFPSVEGSSLYLISVKDTYEEFAAADCGRKARTSGLFTGLWTYGLHVIATALNMFSIKIAVSRKFEEVDRQQAMAQGSPDRIKRFMRWIARNTVMGLLIGVVTVAVNLPFGLFLAALTASDCNYDSNAIHPSAVHPYNLVAIASYYGNLLIVIHLILISLRCCASFIQSEENVDPQVKSWTLCLGFLYLVMSFVAFALGILIVPWGSLFGSQSCLFSALPPSVSATYKAKRYLTGISIFI